MQLSVREAAALLEVSEKQIYAWIDDEAIPFYLVNEQIRCNRAELLEWATAQGLAVSVGLFEEHEGDGLPTLADALERGGIHAHVGGDSREAVLRNVVALLDLPEDMDRDFLLEVLLARENAGSTGIGNGIAIPHVRSPIVLAGAPAAITLCFLDNPVEFGAIDGKPVHTIFTLISATIHIHLQMLAKLARAMHDPGFAKSIQTRKPASDVLAEAGRVEGLLSSPGKPKG